MYYIAVANLAFYYLNKTPLRQLSIKNRLYLTNFLIKASFFPYMEKIFMNPAPLFYKYFY